MAQFSPSLFVVIYQNVIAVLVIVLKLAIPDIPAKLKKKIKRENYITKEMIIKMERRREVLTVMDQDCYKAVSSRPLTILKVDCAYNSDNMLIMKIEY